MASNRTYTTEECLAVIMADSDSDMSDSDAEWSGDNEEIEAVGLNEENNGESATDSEEDEEMDLAQPAAARTQQRQILWEDVSIYDNIDQTWIPPFQQRTGVLVDTVNFQPVDYFKLFFPDDLFCLISEQTNLFAEQFFDNPADLTQHSRFQKWTDTSPSEIQAFVALQIAMGLNCKPSVKDYWRKYWLTETKFGNVMSRDRYLLLSTFLHFSNNEQRVQRGQEGFNPLFKIQPVLDIVSPLYETVYGPGKNLCIDESMIKFKGRIYFRQYLPAKPTKWGIKVFVLCESDSGYGLKFEVYTGKESFVREKGVPLSEQVVLSLLDSYENKGHVVYMDNSTVAQTSTWP